MVIFFERRMTSDGTPYIQHKYQYLVSQISANTNIRLLQFNICKSILVIIDIPFI